MGARQRLNQATKKASGKKKETFLLMGRLSLMTESTSRMPGCVWECVTWNVKGLTADTYSSPKFVI
ncbi:hypothetical protein DPMN_111709 [Dreissena polymorpha]|uniref:Uncharacterized protein n=1 Tax=Dreissena polymorpha TaxID=45954 RepID=A0A9D4KFP9_DREPO|nr:hypothetical protein DPMN_111709 [Dreissena polymorpha]